MQQYWCLLITFSGTVHPEFNLQRGGLNFFLYITYFHASKHDYKEKMITFSLFWRSPCGCSKSKNKKATSQVVCHKLCFKQVVSWTREEAVEKFLSLTSNNDFWIKHMVKALAYFYALGSLMEHRPLMTSDLHLLLKSKGESSWCFLINLVKWLFERISLSSVWRITFFHASEEIPALFWLHHAGTPNRETNR